MAQSALTVTTPSPTPPTNLACTGVTGPNPPNLTRQTYTNWVGVGNTGPNGVYNTPSVTNPPPFFDDGVPAYTTTFASANEIAAVVAPPVSCLTFIANTAALASGTTAADNNTGTTAGTTVTAAGGTGFNSVVGTYPLQGGLVPASSSVAHEGAGTETLATQSYGTSVLAPIILKTVGCGPALTVGVSPQPNQVHASSLSPLTNPTLTSITPGSTVSGVGTTTLTCTGVGFTRQSVVYVNGVAQLTVFASTTSLTCAAVTKKATAGPWNVTVITGGAVTTTAQVWTFT